MLRNSMKVLYTIILVLPSIFLAGKVQAQEPMRLTLHEAEQLALKNNPQITVAKLLTFAQHEATRETRSAELPTAAANLTAVDAHAGTRITAGVLNNPSVFERAGAGVNVGQLITDFGRSHNLVRAASLREQAQQSSQQATA